MALQTRAVMLLLLAIRRNARRRPHLLVVDFQLPLYPFLLVRRRIHFHFPLH